VTAAHGNQGKFLIPRLVAAGVAFRACVRSESSAQSLRAAGVTDIAVGDLSDPDVLAGAARDCGMDADEVRRRLATDEDVAEIEAEAEAAKNGGIDGVPCFIFGGIFAVSGAQPPEYLADAMERAVAERRTAAPAEAEV